MAGQSSQDRRPRRRRRGAALVLSSVAAFVLVSAGAVVPTAAQVAPDVSIALSPTWVPADGFAKTTATATVTSSGVGLPQQPVAFSTDGDVTLSAEECITGPDGSCEVEITASKTTGQATITATSSGLAGLLDEANASATLSEVAPASRLTLFLKPSLIPADGESTSVATVIVREADGEGVADAGPVFGTDEDVTFGEVEENDPGAYTTTITASNTPGVETISAIATGRTATAQLTESGPGTTVTLDLDPSSIPAEEGSTSTATATVIDDNGVGVTDETVEFATDTAADDGGVTFDPDVINHGDGRYTTTITASTTAGPQTITATVDADISDAATLTLTPGAPEAPTLVLEPPEIDAGESSTATATVEDANDNGVPNRQITFSADPPEGVTFSDNGTCETLDDGACATTITGTGAGEYEITAHAENLSSQPQPLTVNVGSVGVVTLDLDPSSIPADGESPSMATATVTDSHGNAVPDQTVAFSTNVEGEDAVAFSENPCTTDDAGNCTTTITASDTPGPQEITATAGSGAAAVSRSNTLTLFGPTSNISLTLDPSSIEADGEDTSIAIAVLEDAQGNGVTNAKVAFGTDGDVTIGEVSNDGDGRYSTTITASDTPGNETITAGGDGKTATATLTEFDPDTSVTLTLEPSSIPADRASTSTAIATVTATDTGEPITDEVVSFATDGDVTFGGPVNQGDGRYTVTITASDTPGTETITATATNANVEGDATLAETPTTVALTSSHSGKCVDVQWNKPDNGTLIWQWSCTGSEAQQWQLVPTGTGSENTYFIKRVALPGKCVDLDISGGGGDDDGDRIQQWDCHERTNQQWRLERRSTDPAAFTIVSVHSDRCLDLNISGRSEGHGDGVRIRQWECNGQTNQLWRVVQLG